MAWNGGSGLYDRARMATDSSGDAAQFPASTGMGEGGANVPAEMDESILLQVNNRKITRNS